MKNLHEGFHGIRNCLFMQKFQTLKKKFLTKIIQELLKTHNESHAIGTLRFCRSSLMLKLKNLHSHV